jgi:hypothetical protein
MVVPLICAQYKAVSLKGEFFLYGPRGHGSISILQLGKACKVSKKAKTQGKSQSKNYLKNEFGEH